MSYSKVYDFYDFGSGRGESIKRFSSLWGGVGCGVDRNFDRAKMLASQGIACIPGDLLEVAHTIPSKSCRFVTMNHVLEHISTLEDIRSIIQQAARIARDFIYIAVPWSDSDGQLFKLGYKYYPQDWPEVHKYNLSSLQVYSAVQVCKPHYTYMSGREPIFDTSDTRIHPLTYDTQRKTKEHCIYTGGKASTRLLENTYRELCCIATLIDDMSPIDKFIAHYGDSL